MQVSLVVLGNQNPKKRRIQTYSFFFFSCCTRLTIETGNASKEITQIEKRFDFKKQVEDLFRSILCSVSKATQFAGTKCHENSLEEPMTRLFKENGASTAKLWQF
jgi:hypothetical protein